MLHVQKNPKEKHHKQQMCMKHLVWKSQGSSHQHGRVLSESWWRSWEICVPNPSSHECSENCVVTSMSVLQQTNDFFNKIDKMLINCWSWVLLGVHLTFFSISVCFWRCLLHKVLKNSFCMPYRSKWETVQWASRQLTKESIFFQCTGRSSQCTEKTGQKAGRPADSRKAFFWLEGP